MALSKLDVEHLMRNPSTVARQEVLTKITSQYNQKDKNPLSPQETKIIEDIFRVIAQGAEEEIRKTLAQQMAHSPNLPKDIAMKMAADIADVSHPILEHSPVLEETDLIEVMKYISDDATLMAIARRENLPESVTSKLIQKNNTHINKTVLASYGSAISDASYDHLTSGEHLDEETIHSIFDKGSLSVTITEKLLSRVTGKIRESLNEKYQVVFENKKIKKEMEKNLQLAASTIMGLRLADAQNQKMLEDLRESGKLMPFSALSMCNCTMFEICLSRMARVPLNNVRILIYTHGKDGLSGLFKKAGIPSNLLNAAYIAVQALQSFEAESAKSKMKSQPTPKDLVARIRTLAGTREIDHLDFLFSLMRNNPE